MEPYAHCEDIRWWIGPSVRWDVCLECLLEKAEGQRTNADRWKTDKLFGLGIGVSGSRTTDWLLRLVEGEVDGAGELRLRNVGNERTVY